MGERSSRRIVAGTTAAIVAAGALGATVGQGWLNEHELERASNQVATRAVEDNFTVTGVVTKKEVADTTGYGYYKSNLDIKLGKCTMDGVVASLVTEGPHPLFIDVDDVALYLYTPGKGKPLAFTDEKSLEKQVGHGQNLSDAQLCAKLHLS